MVKSVSNSESRWAPRPGSEAGRFYFCCSVIKAKVGKQTAPMANGPQKSANFSGIGSGLNSEERRRRLCGQGETIGQSAVVVFSFQIVRVGFSHRTGPRLSGCYQSEIMLGVLEIVLRSDRIAARMSVSRQLKVFVSHVPRSSTNFDVRPIRLVRAGQWVGLATYARRAAPQPVILLRFHLLSFQGSCSQGRRFLGPDTLSGFTC
jgi:hypothetical protein